MSGSRSRPSFSVRATAPVRIADVGGWTDTWFAHTGAVCHLGVGPGVTVEASIVDGPVAPRPVRLVTPDLGDDYECGPSRVAGWDAPEPGRQPLLEHAVASVCARLPPPGPVTVTIRSAVPPGASLGTSASVLVAVVAALEALLARDGPVGTGQVGDEDRRRIAEAAHRVETVRAGRQAGVQDQFAAAFGGAQLIEITDYPTTRRTAIALDPAFVQAIEARTVTVATGAHDSSSVHRAVIASLDAPRRSAGAAPAPRALLGDLRDLAVAAADALGAADLESWAATLTAATDVQERLHAGLIGPDHRDLIALADDEGALGWKVNGAGGDGGSTTIVCASASAAERFTALVEAARPTFTVLGLRLQGGVELRRVAPDGQ